MSSIEQCEKIKKVSQIVEFYYFLEVMKKCSDENNILTEPEIVYHMEKLINTQFDTEIDRIDRRRIYKYIEGMKELNYDISLREENKKGYYLKTRKENENFDFKYRDLEKEEVDILVASVLSNKYLTKTQQNNFKKKLYEMTTIYHSYNNPNPIINKNITIVDKINVYEYVKTINQAIKYNKKISYDLYKTRYDKKLIKKENQTNSLSKREVSPIGTVIKNDRYYFIFVNIEKGECKIKSTRLDRMKNISISMDDVDDFSKYDNYIETLKRCSDNRGKRIIPDIYAKKHMKMYSGDDYDIVKLKTDEYSCGYIIEELGVDYDIDIQKIEEENKYTVSFEAAITEGLAKWILALDTQVEVLEPIELRDMIIKKLEKLYDIYESNISKKLFDRYKSNRVNDVYKSSELYERYLVSESQEKYIARRD